MALLVLQPATQDVVILYQSLDHSVLGQLNY